MGLITNIHRESNSPTNFIGGIISSGEFNSFFKEESWMTIYAGEAGISEGTSFPDNNTHPVTWRLPNLAGNIEAFNKLDGNSSAIGYGAMGYPLIATIEGSGTIANAEASLLASLVATILNEGTLSSSLVGGLFALCDITGISTVTSNLTDGITRVNIESTIAGIASTTIYITGGKNAQTTINGSGNITSALSALAGMISEILNNGTISNALSTAKGNLEVNITPFTTLSPESLAMNVWNSIAAEYTNPLTMGGKLNLASSGGVDYAALATAVWDEVNTGHNVPDSQSVILKQIATLADELHKIQGLDVNNPMTITPTSRISGDVELELSGDGVAKTIVTRI